MHVTVRNAQSREGTKGSLHHLACKHAPQVTLNAPDGNCPKDKQQTYQKTQYAVKKGKTGFPETVQYTVQGTCNI